MFNVPKFTAGSVISIIEWISDSLIAIASLDYKIQIVNVDNGDVLFYYQVENEKLGVKSIKYFKNHLVFYLFNGEVGIVNHDFIVEK